MADVVDEFERAVAQREPAGAIFSEDERYRYVLWRVWDWSKPYLNVIGLNPSTADATVLDPTCTRCERRARALGYGGYVMTNLFALKSTDPRALRSDPKPCGGVQNDFAVLAVAGAAGLVLAAWGAHGALNGHADVMLDELRGAGVELHRLEWTDRSGRVHGLTESGQPRHPLYAPHDASVVLWSAA